tara:strand:+ start:94 stop:408 length:315 start_codon:yes stop_codon:yes gene_type:complete
VFTEEYWKLIVGITLGLSFLIFGTVFWDSATGDYYSNLSQKNYEIETCAQYMDPPLASISDRDECVQKRQIGAIFLAAGTLTLWATLYFNKEKLSLLFKIYNSN